MSIFGQVFTTSVSKLVYQGWGLGQLDGRAIFIPNALPGDVVEAQVAYKKQGAWFAKITQIVTPSTYRMDSPCPHFTVCGGCQLLNVDYMDQLKLKTSMLEDAIHRVFPEILPKLEPIVAASCTRYHRNKMDFAFGQKYGNVFAGLKARGKFDEITEVDGCLLQSPTTSVILRLVSEFFTQRTTSVWDYKTHQGILRYLVIRHSKTQDKFLLNFIVGSDQRGLIQTLAPILTGAVPQISGILMTVHDQPSDTSALSHYELIWGESTLKETLLDQTFTISPPAFFQTNTAQAQVLFKLISELADPQPTDQLFDLYCGTGTIGLSLAPKVRQVVGIEENASAIDDALLNAKNNGVTNAIFLREKVKNYLKFTQEKPDIVITDPPRSGLEPKALMRTLALQAPRWVYVSCNPVTLLRDLKIACENGYYIERLIPVDMFPHSYHVEVVTKLKRG